MIAHCYLLCTLVVPVAAVVYACSHLRPTPFTYPVIFKRNASFLFPVRSAFIPEVTNILNCLTEHIPLFCSGYGRNEMADMTPVPVRVAYVYT